MSFLNSVIGELFGMFVDDGSLAIAILHWIGVIAALQVSALVPSGLGLILYLGLAVLLMESVLRRARSH